jgi:hypothetical protein
MIHVTISNNRLTYEVGDFRDAVRGLDAAKNMAADKGWPFFKTTLENMDIEEIIKF